MKTEKNQAKTTSKFNLEKMRVAQLDNLDIVNGGSGLSIISGNGLSIVNGVDDKTLTDSDHTITETV